MMKDKILVVDNERDMLLLLGTILSKEGYEVIADWNGELVEHLQFDFPQLILMDIGLDGKDGEQICRLLKAQKKSRDIPLIMLSSHPNIRIVSETCGAEDYLSKPFTITELLEKIKKNIHPIAA